MPLELNPTAPRPREETEPLVDRRQTNPMFNDQRMKLGLFGTNCSCGLCVSTAPTNYRATWEQTLTIVLDAQGARFRTTLLAMMCVMALGAPALFRSGEERRHSNLDNLQDIAR